MVVVKHDFMLGRKLDGFEMDDDNECWLTSKIKKRPGEVRQVMVYIDI